MLYHNWKGRCKSFGEATASKSLTNLLCLPFLWSLEKGFLNLCLRAGSGVPEKPSIRWAYLTDPPKCHMYSFKIGGQWHSGQLHLSSCPVMRSSGLPGSRRNCPECPWPLIIWYLGGKMRSKQGLLFCCAAVVTLAYGRKHWIMSWVTIMVLCSFWMNVCSHPLRAGWSTCRLLSYTEDRGFWELVKVF